MNSIDPATDPTLAPDVRAKALADEYTHLAEQAEHIKGRQEQIKEALGELLPNGGPAGDYKVTVTRPKRLDTKALTEAFPVTAHPELYRPSLDTAEVKRHLSPVDLEQYQKAGNPIVKVA